MNDAAAKNANLGYWPNLPAMFFTKAGEFSGRPFLWSKPRGGQYEPLTWKEVSDKVSGLGKALLALDVKPGDRVGLVAENCPEWLITDVAAMAVGGVTVPAYTTNTVKDHIHVMSDSGACGVIVSTARLAERVIAAANECPDVRFVICIEDPGTDHGARSGLEVITWDAAVQRGAGRSDDITAIADKLTRKDTACIIYTSGTGGAPKGVVLSHGAILQNVEAVRGILTPVGVDGNVFLSFLPLSHAYEHMAGQFFPMELGAEIYYAEGIESLLTNLAESKPTLMTAVPRLYESMHLRIMRGVQKEGGMKEFLFMMAVRIGTERHRGNRLGPFNAVMDKVLNKLVRDKVRGRFGGRLKALVSGGAPLPEELGVFFTALGLRLLQGYGMTEAAPLISVNHPFGYKMHTVGPPIPGLEVRIADDGEICMRGENIMQGYWNNPESTAETVKDGWLHTGDIGKIDEDGHIIITDRKKNIIVNSGGDNVAPQRVEGLLCLEQAIEQAVVFGDQRPHLAGLLVMDEEWTKEWAAANTKSFDPEALSADGAFIAAVGGVVDRVNTKLSNIEKVRKFLICPTPFSIEDGTMTPTLKTRRHVIWERWGERLEKLYR